MERARASPPCERRERREDEREKGEELKPEDRGEDEPVAPPRLRRHCFRPRPEQERAYGLLRAFPAEAVDRRKACGRGEPYCCKWRCEDHSDDPIPLSMQREFIVDILPYPVVIWYNVHVSYRK